MALLNSHKLEHLVAYLIVFAMEFIPAAYGRSSLNINTTPTSLQYGDIEASCEIGILKKIIVSEQGNSDAIRKLTEEMNQFHYYEDETFNSAKMSTEYKVAINRFLQIEYSNLSSSLRATVDAIHVEGKVPVFRAIVGEWRKGFYGDNRVSTSLSAIAALDVAMPKITFENRVVNLVVSSWDGRGGTIGSDALEIELRPSQFKVERKIEIPTKFIDFYQKNINIRHQSREDVYPKLMPVLKEVGR